MLRVLFHLLISCSRFRIILVICSFFLSANIIAIQMANSHSNASGIVKERMDFMKDLAKASKSIGQMIRGQTQYDINLLAKQAQRIKEHSLNLLDYFPPDSLQKPTEALPAIWENWDDFEKRNEVLRVESQKLLDTVETGEEKAIAKQFSAIAKSCKACHKDYRKKKQ